MYWCSLAVQVLSGVSKQFSLPCSIPSCAMHIVHACQSLSDD